MEYVVIAGQRYACPFAGEFPDLTDDEEAYLRQSIAEIGVYHAALTYDSPTHGKSLIQGRNRLRIGGDLGVPVPVQHLGPMSDADARKRANDIQAAGRQLTVGQVEQARRRRLDRIVAARDGGASLRTIAAKEGVSHEQVRKDLIASGVNRLTPDRVTGADGKSYASRKDEDEGDEPDEDTPLAPSEPDPTPEQEAAFSLQRAGLFVEQLSKEVIELLAGPLGDKLRAAATKHGAGFGRGEWRPLRTVREILEAVRDE